MTTDNNQERARKHYERQRRIAEAEFAIVDRGVSATVTPGVFIGLCADDVAREAAIDAAVAQAMADYPAAVRAAARERRAMPEPPTLMRQLSGATLRHAPNPQAAIDAARAAWDRAHAASVAAFRAYADAVAALYPDVPAPPRES